MIATSVSSDVKIAQTPPMPTFATVEQERVHRKQRLASAFRLFAKFGFSEGVAGHITVRDPERTDHFWVNPFGMHFGHIRVSDLVMVNEKGEVAVRYGRVMVRDAGVGAKQLALALEPVLSADGKEMSIVVPQSWLSRAEYPVEVDPLVVKGVPDGYRMPQFREQLNDQQIADIVSFIRNSWGNHAASASAQAVTALRKQTDPASDEVVILKMR